jgi:hypothetical protein
MDAHRSACSARGCNRASVAVVATSGTFLGVVALLTAGGVVSAVPGEGNSARRTVRILMLPSGSCSTRLRIPVGPGHRFRRNPGTDSDMTRALNPERPGH